MSIGRRQLVLEQLLAVADEHRWTMIADGVVQRGRARRRKVTLLHCDGRHTLILEATLRGRLRDHQTLSGPKYAGYAFGRQQVEAALRIPGVP